MVLTLLDGKETTENALLATLVCRQVLGKIESTVYFYGAAGIYHPAVADSAVDDDRRICLCAMAAVPSGKATRTAIAAAFGAACTSFGGNGTGRRIFATAEADH